MLCLALTFLTTWVGLPFPPVANLTGCYSPTPSKNLGLAMIPPLVHEVILCFCMLYKAWQTYKHEYGSPLLRLLIQDRSAYFWGCLYHNPTVLTTKQFALLFQVMGFDNLSECRIDILLYSILAVLLTICVIIFLAPPGLLEFGLGCVIYHFRDGQMLTGAIL
jgi:hypothetical protein